MGKQVDVNIDYILMLVAKYHKSIAKIKRYLHLLIRLSVRHFSFVQRKNLLTALSIQSMLKQMLPMIGVSSFKNRRSRTLMLLSQNRG